MAPWIIQLGVTFMFKKIKAKLAAKAAASLSSSTMGVVAVLLAVAGWVQANPETVASVVGNGWGGVAAVVVAVARVRSL
jgi:hypothetical protein